MKLLAKYKNGNYTVRLFDDGTKIRMNDLDNLTPSFAESMDVTITEKCNGGCQWCYLNCTEDKPHADLNNPIFDTVHPGTEMAINANDMTHPGLETFLIKMKDKGVFVNMTINQKHLKQNVERLKEYQDRQLVWGIGISLTDSTDPILWKNGLKNTVIHVIDGCLSKEDIENLADHNLKLLMLGFKHKGRGNEYYETHKAEVDANIQYLNEHIQEYSNRFCGIGFDTLATIDLHMEEKVGPEKWALYHMGAEGAYTYFIDAVNNRFAISSMETEKIFDIQPEDTVDTMFKRVRKEAGHDK